MTGIARKGIDSAGGTIIGGSSDVFVNGAGSVRIGDGVEGHGSGPHAGTSMASGSSTVFVNGIPVCRAGDSATCGHTASGSGDTFAG